MKFAHAILSLAASFWSCVTLSSRATCQAPDVQVLQLDATLAFGARQWERAADAYRKLASTSPGLSFDQASKYGYALLYTGLHDGAVAEFRRAYERGDTSRRETASAAYNLACAHAVMGDRSAALGWLTKAGWLGFDSVSHYEGDDDLAIVRRDATASNSALSSMREPLRHFLGSLVTTDLGSGAVEPQAEGVFLLHVIEHVLTTWPTGSRQEQDIGGWVSTAFDLVAGLQLRAKEASPAIDAVYESTKQLLADYRDFLALHAIVTNRDVSGYGFSDFFLDFELGKATALASRGSWPGAIAGLVLAVLPQILADDSEGRAQDRREIIELQARGLQRKLDANLATFGRIAPQTQGYAQSGSPFAQWSTAWNGRREATELARCIAVVPPARAFDPLRFRMAIEAGEHFVSMSSSDSSYSFAQGSTHAAAAVTFLVAACASAPPSQQNRALAALAAGLGFDKRYELAVIARLFAPCDEDPVALYDLACLYSADRRLSKSLATFEKALAAGYHRIKRARVDPDLAFLRDQLGGRFDAICSPNAVVSIDGDLFVDVRVKNVSRFPVTNVVLTVTRTWDDGSSQAHELTVPFIGIGETHTWTNVWRAWSGYRWSWKATCDQTPDR